MSKTTVKVNAARVRKHLRLPTDTTDDQVRAELAKPTPAKGERKSTRATGSRDDAAQRAFYSEHFPELEAGA